MFHKSPGISRANCTLLEKLVKSKQRVYLSSLWLWAVVVV